MTTVQTSAVFSETMLVVKGRCAGEVRRIPILNRELTYDELCFMMYRLFRPRLSSNIDNLILRYTDGDGDLVSLTDDVDVQHSVSQSQVLRVTVFDKEVLPPPDEALSNKPLQLPNWALAVRQELLLLREKVDRLLNLVNEDDSKETNAVNGNSKEESDVAAHLKSLTTQDLAELLSSSGRSPKLASTPSVIVAASANGNATSSRPSTAMGQPLSNPGTTASTATSPAHVSQTSSSVTAAQPSVVSATATQPTTSNHPTTSTQPASTPAPAVSLPPPVSSASATPASTPATPALQAQQQQPYYGQYGAQPHYAYPPNYWQHPPAGYPPQSAPQNQAPPSHYPPPARPPYPYPPQAAQQQPQPGQQSYPPNYPPQPPRY